MAINLIKVEKRLRDCEHHLKQLHKFSNSLDVENFEREWFGFLVSLASVRDALNKSTLLDPKLVAWRKDMKNAIHSDALLNYLRCARNTDCHGLESTTGPEVGGAEYLGFAYPNVEFGFDSGQVIKGGAIHLAGDVKEFTSNLSFCQLGMKIEKIVQKLPLTFLLNIKGILYLIVLR